MRKGGFGAIAYAVCCYFAGVAGLAYCVLFVNDFIVAGVSQPATHNLGVALATNLGLLLFWGAQHSIMARSWFKKRWTRWIPAHTERATYCLASGVALAVVCAGWAPVGGTAWSIDAAWFGALGFAGWGVLLLATFEIDHFELFGLRQPWRAWRGIDAPTPRFQQRYLYRIVRHPIQLGVLMGLWLTEEMTVSRLVFAVSMTVYIAIGLHFEERALVRELGSDYEDYRRRVPMLIPFLRWPRTPEIAPAGN